jgi:hypothetical protein
MLKSANKKPCPKCGGRMVFNGSNEEQTALIIILFAALAFMALFGLVWELNNLGP